jgi:hypothetical protein
MRYLFVGDTHGSKDLDKLCRALPSLQLTPRDALIHCGDFGAPWASDDDKTLRWWRALTCKKIICLGNHENYGWIGRQPVVRRFGCRGYDLGGGLFAPLAGQIARIGGRSFWFYPGGFSVDFLLRKPGYNVFQEELTPALQARAALNKLLRHGPVDYVISHDGPRQHVMQRFGFPLGLPPSLYWQHLNQPADSRTHPAFLLDQVYARPDLYGRWYFGHHHRDDAVGKLRCLWQHMVLEDGLTGQAQLIEPSA